MVVVFTLLGVMWVELRVPPYLLWSEAIPFETVLSTGEGYFEYRDLFTVIQNQSEWEETWGRLSLSRTQAGREPVPMDFSNTTLIGAFRRRCPNGGYRIEITYIGRLSDRVHVTVFTGYVGGFVVESITSPTHVVRIAKTSLPVEFHVFDEGVKLWTKIGILMTGAMASILTRVFLKRRGWSL